MNENTSQPQPDSATNNPDPDQMERELKKQLETAGHDPGPILGKLAYLYSKTKRPELALNCLRRQLELEPDLERKAGCVLAMGGLMEQLNDFPAAIKFYREALSMQPVRNEAWYFIHNNLGFSYNQLGDFANGEKFCRAALQINPCRPNAHKNLGLALAGQGHYRQAASCYVTGTCNHAGDSRSFRHLKELVEQHPELEFELQHQLEHCEKLVEFAARAIDRARAGNPLKVLLGISQSDWLDMYGYMLQAITGRAVGMKLAESLSNFVEMAGAEKFDLGFLAPSPIPVSPAIGRVWTNALLAVKQLHTSQTLAVILVGSGEEVALHEKKGLKAGAAAVLEMSRQTEVLVDTTIRVLSARL